MVDWRITSCLLRCVLRAVSRASASRSSGNETGIGALIEESYMLSGHFQARLAGQRTDRKPDVRTDRLGGQGRKTGGVSWKPDKTCPPLTMSKVSGHAVHHRRFWRGGPPLVNCGEDGRRFHWRHPPQFGQPTRLLPLQPFALAEAR